MEDSSVYAYLLSRDEINRWNRVPDCIGNSIVRYMYKVETKHPDVHVCYKPSTFLPRLPHPSTNPLNYKNENTYVVA